MWALEFRMHFIGNEGLVTRLHNTQGLFVCALICVEGFICEKNEDAFTVDRSSSLTHDGYNIKLPALWQDIEFDVTCKGARSLKFIKRASSEPRY
jgi:hypothetical protein